MYQFKVNGDTYKIRFGYRVLYQSDLMDRVINATAGTDGAPAESIKNLIGLTGELLLAGLQKHHRDAFGYETDEERSEKLGMVCDLIDDYEDEHTDEDGKRDKDGFTLFSELQEELSKNGFLSRVSEQAQQTLAEQDATVVPMEHQRKKRKVGESK